MRKLYDALKPRYINPDSPEALRSLNIFCVRVVFLLYAEDSGLLNRGAFYEFLNLNRYNARISINDLFKVLAQKPEDRGPYIDSDLKKFPYVDGSLFEDTLNPETRSKNGMHYNIHKVIAPLFFDNLKTEFDAIIN